MIVLENFSRMSHLDYQHGKPPKPKEEKPKEEWCCVHCQKFCNGFNLVRCTSCNKPITDAQKEDFKLRKKKAVSMNGGARLALRFPSVWAAPTPDTPRRVPMYSI